MREQTMGTADSNNHGKRTSSGMEMKKLQFVYSTDRSKSIPTCTKIHFTYYLLVSTLHEMHNSFPPCHFINN